MIELWSLFVPWHKDLQRHGGLVDMRSGGGTKVLPEDPDGFMWLQVIPHKKVPRMIIEGLELLALLAYADWDQWKELVAELWPKRENKWEQALARRPATVGVKINYSMDAKVDFVFKLLARSSQEPKTPNQFVLARGKLLGVIAAQGERVTEIPVCVTRDYYKKIDLQLTKVQETVVMQKQLCAPPTGRSKKQPPSYYGLRVRAINMDMGEDKFKLSRLQLLGEIAACGVTVDYLQPPTKATRQEDPSKYMDAMTHLLPASGQNQSHATGVTYVSMEDGIDSYPGMFSALRVNDSVQSVFFQPYLQPHHSDDKKRLAWSWLAYGILSKPSSGGHRIEDLCIHADSLNQVALDGIVAILQADDPLAFLFNLEVGRVSQETISASRFALVDPLANQNVVTWSSGRTYNDLEVIERGQDWMSVLLPGWGKAWVHCGDLEMARPSTSSANKIQSIPTVDIRNMDGESKDALVGLLRLIGPGIRHLNLGYDPRRSAVDDLLPQIFQACPHLLSFQSACKQIDSLQVFVDAFTSRACRLESLQLGDIKFTDEKDTLKRFFEALSDKEQPIARRLEEFKIRTLHVDSIVDTAVAASLVTMLQKNQQLRHLELKIRREDSLHPGLTQFERFDKQPIMCRLDLSSKVAFLSALSYNTSNHVEDTQQPARQKLDSQIVGMIFQFANTMETRRVIIGKD